MTSIAFCSTTRTFVGDRIAGTPPTHDLTSPKIIRVRDGVVAFALNVHCIDLSVLPKLTIEEVIWYIQSLEFRCLPEPLELTMLSCKADELAYKHQFFAPMKESGDTSVIHFVKVQSQREGAPGAVMFIGGQEFINPIESGRMISFPQLVLRTCYYHLSVGVYVPPTIINATQVDYGFDDGLRNVQGYIKARDLMSPFGLLELDTVTKVLSPL